MESYYLSLEYQKEWMKQMMCFQYWWSRIFKITDKALTPEMQKQKPSRIPKKQNYSLQLVIYYLNCRKLKTKCWKKGGGVVKISNLSNIKIIVHLKESCKWLRNGLKSVEKKHYQSRILYPLIDSSKVMVKITFYWNWMTREMSLVFA